jgi:hypothetical protein
MVQPQARIGSFSSLGTEVRRPPERACQRLALLRQRDFVVEALHVHRAVEVLV